MKGPARGGALGLVAALDRDVAGRWVDGSRRRVPHPDFDLICPGVTHERHALGVCVERDLQVVVRLHAGQRKGRLGADRPGRNAGWVVRLVEIDAAPAELEEGTGTAVGAGRGAVNKHALPGGAVAKNDK